MLYSLAAFSFFIVFDQYFLSLLLLLAVVLFLFLATLPLFKGSLPTPFSKKPFEFSIGFRKTWLLLCAIYSLGIIGLVVVNVNLCLFSLMCICLCSTFYYLEPEPVFFHWNQHRNAIDFLKHKIGRGVMHLSYLILPLGILFCVCFPLEYYKVAVIWLAGSLVIPFIIFLKYAVYPRRIHVSETFMIALCFLFYPLILALIPYYYFKAVENLKSLS